MTFLVDVNLPRFFLNESNQDFIFSYDIDQRLPDTELWRMALKNGYTILTRDMDFYYRAKESLEFPKMVIFRFGNLRLNEMRKYFMKNWPRIIELIKEHNLIFAWEKELEIVY